DWGLRPLDNRFRMPDQPDESAVIRVEVQSCQQAARAYSLNDLNVSIVNRRGKPNAPFARQLLDARRERQFRFELRSFQGGPAQLHHRNRFERHCGPTVLAIACGDTVTVLRVNDRGTLSRRFGKNFYLPLVSFRTVTAARSFGNEACDAI